MHGTVRARRLVIAVGAFVETNLGVIEELLTVGAELCLGFVMRRAIDADHLANCLRFSFEMCRVHASPLDDGLLFSGIIRHLGSAALVAGASMRRRGNAVPNQVSACEAMGEMTAWGLSAWQYQAGVPVRW